MIFSMKNLIKLFNFFSIPKVNFVKLISCSLCNSWYNLTKEGSASLGEINSQEGVSVSKIPQGHYTLDSLAKEIDSLFDKHKYKDLKTETDGPFSRPVIKNWGGKTKATEFDRDLARLLGRWSKGQPLH